MSEVRRTSDGVELGPRVPDGRSYDERQIASGPRPEPRIYYQDEAVTLWHGDCRDVLPELPMVDLLLTDPPYGIGADGGVGKYGREKWSEAAKWDDVADSKLVSLALHKAMFAIVWGGNYFALPPSRAFLVWDKGAGFRNRDFAECEQAWCSWDGNAKVLARDPLAAGDYKGKEHPTEKPEAVMRWALMQAPGPAATVLDPFAGSGTTGVAAKRLGRKAILIEREEKYCAVAARRLSQGALNLEFSA